MTDLERGMFALTVNAVWLWITWMFEILGRWAK